MEFDPLRNVRQRRDILSLLNLSPQHDQTTKRYLAAPEEDHAETPSHARGPVNTTITIKTKTATNHQHPIPTCLTIEHTLCRPDWKYLLEARLHFCYFYEQIYLLLIGQGVKWLLVTPIMMQCASNLAGSHEGGRQSQLAASSSMKSRCSNAKVSSTH